jgi:hypothetical protein
MFTFLALLLDLEAEVIDEAQQLVLLVVVGDALLIAKG